MNPVDKLEADVREALDSFPGAPCSCPKHKFLLDAKSAVSELARVARDSQEALRELTDAVPAVMPQLPLYPISDEWVRLKAAYHTGRAALVSSGQTGEER